METVEDLILKLKRLPEVVNDAGLTAIETSETDITNLNKAQLLSGVDSQDDSLGEYTPYSKQLREAKGLQTDHIDLRDTGAFQSSITLIQKGKEYEVDAQDEKWKAKLQPQWPDALGLTTQSEDAVSPIIEDKIGKIVDEFL